MKFRYKVMIINFMFLSVGLGVVCFLMLNKNYQLAFENDIRVAIDENNLIQSSVEYELLQIMNSEKEYKLKDALNNIGKQISTGQLTQNSLYCIKLNDEYVFEGDKDIQVDENLFDKIAVGDKKYIVKKKEDKVYVYVTSASIVEDDYIYVITRKNISAIYDILEEELKYFRIAIIVLVLVASFAIIFVAKCLTRPLEKLNIATDKIAKGEYDIDIELEPKNRDEVQDLAEKFNNMAKVIMDRIEKLNEMVRSREQFVADFTHEIKTPMTSIIGYADTLRSVDMDREEEIEALSYIFSEAKRLEKLSHNLINLIYVNQKEISLTNVDMESIVNTSIRIIMPTFEKSEVLLEKNIKSEKLKLNYDLFVTAIVNVLDNARKASNKGQKVVITGKRMKGEYLLDITDMGIGISEEDCKKICDEFYMVDKSRAREDGGAGIGMSLVKAIVRANCARLKIDSVLGKGTSVKIYISVSEEL